MNKSHFCIFYSPWPSTSSSFLIQKKPVNHFGIINGAASFPHDEWWAVQATTLRERIASDTNLHVYFPFYNSAMVPIPAFERYAQLLLVATALGIRDLKVPRADAITTQNNRVLAGNP